MANEHFQILWDEPKRGQYTVVDMNDPTLCETFDHKGTAEDYIQRLYAEEHRQRNAGRTNI